jgi:hypothetical protein
MSNLQWKAFWNGTISDDDIHGEATRGEPAVRLDDPTRKPMKVTQAEYQDASMLNYAMEKRGSDLTDFKTWRGPAQEIMTNAPSKKAVVKADVNLTAPAKVWNSSWAKHTRLKLR